MKPRRRGRKGKLYSYEDMLALVRAKFEQQGHPILKESEEHIKLFCEAYLEKLRRF